MQIPIQITFRHMEPSAALETAIRDRASKLDSVHPRVTSCRVVLESIAAHKHQGKLYTVHIDLKVPGHEIAINRDRHEDVFVALRDAFDAAKRQLEDELRLQRSLVKQHEVPLHGKVARVDAEGGYGFILGADGSEYYFSLANVVAPGAKRPGPGDEVQFIADLHGDTPQAKRVSLGKHHF